MHHHHSANIFITRNNFSRTARFATFIGRYNVKKLLKLEAMTKHFSRRQFLNTTLGFSALALTNIDDFKKHKPLLSFSTLGCPDWTFDQILSFAANNGYSGIEIRGIQRQMDLTKVPEFGKDQLENTVKRLKEKKLKIVNLGSSATMHFSDPTERSKNMEEGKNFIQLANALNCPYIRVFPNLLPKDKDKNETMKLIADGLNTLGDYAKDKNVRVLMETHGDLVHIADLQTVMSQANHPNVGLVWDMVNMWSITKEPPEEMYAALKKYIYHTHIKDASFVDGKLRYVFLGKGETPISKAVQLLRNGGYKGYYSFEWEKLWHPEIEAPELAIADYSKSIKQWMK
jgi:sugar phosphate isomerase/epimerase